MKGTVSKPFPFSFDGNTFVQLKAGDDFPPKGLMVADNFFTGLADAGFIQAVTNDSTQADIDLNTRVVAALDKHLSDLSDEELKGVIARRGTPFTGNMVHAVLVGEAKAQMVAEMEGAVPVRFTDPNAGVTEQPLSAAGQATPPSAAAAIVAQQAQQEAAEQQAKDAASQDTGQTGASSTGDGSQPAKTDQFGDPIPGTVSSAGDDEALSEAVLNTMNKTDLEAYGAKRGIDLSTAKTKADYIELLKPKA
jgi:hypothetical protein